MSKTNETPKEPLTEQLARLFQGAFDEDWRREISLTLRADSLYWVLYLAQTGLEQHELALRSKAPRQREATEVASVCSWRLELERLVERIERTLPPMVVKSLAGGAIEGGHGHGG